MLRFSFKTGSDRGGSVFWSGSFGPPALALAALAVSVAFPRSASAQPPDPALIERLSHHVEAINQLGKRASLHLESLMEELDGDGKVSSTTIEQSRVEADGKATHQIVEKAVKDGKDVTAEEQEKVKKEEAEEAANKANKNGAKKGDGPDLAFPFSSSASNDYVYDQVNVDAADPTRVEIAFTPKKPSKHTVEGKAWVDTTTGTILSAGAKLSKPPTFVDWVHFTVELGAKTPLGPAMSHLTFEAKGGLLFIRKHVRGEVKMTDYRVAP
jgi:hypothetical protein